MYADILLHILQDIYQISAPPLLSGTNIYNSPYVNFKLSRTFEATQIKHIPKFFCNTKTIVHFSSADIDTLVVPLSIDFCTKGYERVGAFIQSIYAYVD